MIRGSSARPLPSSNADQTGILEESNCSNSWSSLKRKMDGVHMPWKLPWFMPGSRKAPFSILINISWWKNFTTCGVTTFSTHRQRASNLVSASKIRTLWNPAHYWRRTCDTRAFGGMKMAKHQVLPMILERQFSWRISGPSSRAATSMRTKHIMIVYFLMGILDYLTAVTWYIKKLHCLVTRDRERHYSEDILS